MKLSSFESIVRVLNDANARYLIVGGLAVVAHDKTTEKNFPRTEKMKVDATVRNLEIIGEAAKRLPSAVKARNAGS